MALNINLTSDGMKEVHDKEDKQREMPGVKRSHEGSEKEGNESTSPFMPMFDIFRQELDEHHDRRERVIKASRDITAASKKIIFALQRVRSLNTAIPAKIASEVEEKNLTIEKLFQSIIPDLVGINAWRYQRQLFPGIQEFMEAISFSHYLGTQSLITMQEASLKLPEGIPLTSDDYVLGLFDLVGELMRFAITTMATTGSLPGMKKNEGEEKEKEERSMITDLRLLRASFEGLDTSQCGGNGLGRELEKKMAVMETCVEKVEKAVYGMIIRGRERPEGWVPDLGGEGVVVEGY